MRQIVSNLEKLKLPTTHSGSTGECTRHGSDDTARRPPSVKAALSVSFGQRAPHRSSTRDSSPIRRTVPGPSHERNVSEERRSPRSRRSGSHEYYERDRDRSRSRDRSRDHDHDRDRDRDRYRERDRDRERDRRRERDRERSYDYDMRSKYGERESSRDYDYRRHDDGGRHHRSRSRSRSRSLQAGSARFESHSSAQRDLSKDKTSASSNLAKLKDIYGDLGDNKRDVNSERIPGRDNGGEEVIRLGGSTWKY